MKKYLSELNPEQLKVVQSTKGPIMVLAGPGSGKTKTIVAKIIYLIDELKVEPWKILAMTFSNRAANEMKERVHKSLPDMPESSLSISTFHSYCARILRQHGAGIGLKNSFTIYDSSESNAVIKQILRNHEIDPKKTPPSALAGFIEKVQNDGFYPKRTIPLKKELAKHALYPLYLEYVSELARNNAVDFGGLITRVVELLETNEEVKNYYNNRFEYLLIDEYQDTNKAQFELIKLFTQKNKNVCVVGDEDQCVIKGTKILTPTGEVSIEKLKVGDEVISAKGKDIFLPTKITRIHKKPYEGDIVEVTTKSGKILSTTKEHIHFACFSKNIKAKESSKVKCLITMFSGTKLNSKKSTHRLSINGYNQEVFKKLTPLGFKIKSTKKNCFSVEKISSDLSELYNLYKEIAKVIDLNLEEKALINHNSLNLIPASHLKPGMIVFTENGSTEEIYKVNNKKIKTSVFDLDIENSHNYIANGIVTHNSIYSWRGAEIKNILDFEITYPNTQTFHLGQNYRSTSHIVSTANDVIQKNIYRKGKKIWTTNTEGEKVRVYQCSDAYKEALFVAQTVSDLLKKKTPAKEIAVFYRTNAQSRLMEDSFRKYMIPYQVIGGQKFYERKEVKDMVAYLQVLANPQDEVSLNRIINFPARGLGDKTIEKLMSSARYQGLNLWDYLLKNKKSPTIFGGAKAQSGILDFISIMESGIAMIASGKKASEIYNMILEKTNYIEILKISTKYEDQARIENLQELKSSMTQFETMGNTNLTEYLETITLDRTEEVNEGGKVSLMTIHASKGLEFEQVFLSGCEETIFPSPQSLSEGLERAEEERRLFYVAITRAKKQLYILHSLQRMVFGKTSFNPPSRFLMELPKERLQKFRV